MSFFAGVLSGGRDYVFATTCVDADGDDIQEMARVATQISIHTFAKHVPLQEVRNMLGYERRRQPTLAQDWAIGWYRSVYRGCPCYYVRWSGIEHIWIRRDCAPTACSVSSV